MLSLILASLVGLLFASPTSASPTRVNSHLLLPLNEVTVRSPLDVARDPSVEKRISADFSLNHEWRNEVLFEGGWSDNGADGAESVSLSVVCRECWTKGDVTARLTTRDIIKPVVRLELGGVEAYVDVAVDVSANAIYAINLFTSNTPVGIGFPGLSVGLVFYVDLVFSASAVLDLDGGFYVTLEEDAFLEADVFDGDITDSLFDGIGTKTFPITVRTGNAVFKAAIRLRVQLGAETQVPLLGISLGGGAVVGVYANIIEFVAEIDTNEDCALETRESFNLNVGAFARAGFDVDFTSIGVAPTVSTTLFDSPTWTQCWIEKAPANSAIDGGKIVPTPGSTSLVTPPAGLPGLPAFGGETATTVASQGSLVLATTLSTPMNPSVVKEPRPTTSPTAVLAPPHKNGTVFTPGAPELITTTVYSTTEYILTRCAASVMNCPGSLQSQVVVTKTVDAFTTICPPVAEVTIPPRHSSVAGAELPVAHVITKVTRLQKLATPIVNTFHETSSEQPSADRVTAADVTSNSSGVLAPTVHKAITAIPVASELPVAVQKEVVVSQKTPTPSESGTTQALSPVQTAAGSNLRTFWPVQVLTGVIFVIVFL